MYRMYSMCTSAVRANLYSRFFPTHPAFFSSTSATFFGSFKPRPVMEGSVSSKSPDETEETVNLEQISLRALDLSDLDDVMVWTSDEKVAKFSLWEPCTSKEDVIAFIKRTSQFTWFRAICLNNRVIGYISVNSYSGYEEWRARTAALAYALASKYWGKGIVTHVVKLVAKTIFSELPQLLRLEAMVDVRNMGSQRVLEKTGFHREGILRNYAFFKGRKVDLFMFSLLPTDFQP